jgi:hypothetical protein
MNIECKWHSNYMLDIFYNGVYIGSVIEYDKEPQISFKEPVWLTFSELTVIMDNYYNLPKE